LLAASASAANVHKHVRYVKLVVEQGFFVDNDPSGQSGGDLFGSTGVLRHRTTRSAPSQPPASPHPQTGGSAMSALCGTAGIDFSSRARFRCRAAHRAA
jgi:hypothetical protein